VLTALALSASVAEGQRGQPASTGCRGERISIITILTLRPSEIDRMSEMGITAEFLRRIWVPTNPEVVRGFLRVKEGRVCTELARSESERILRAQPFIADARIRVIPLGGDSIGLAVETQDEFPIDGALQFRDLAMSRVQLGTQNFDGSGIGFSAEWREGFAYRDGFGVQYRDALTAGRPWLTSLSARRDPLGGFWEASLRAPFYTDLQRNAWFVGARNVRAFVPFRRAGQQTVLVDSERFQWLASFGRRIGTPRRAGIGSLLLEGEDVLDAESAIVATDSGPVRYTGTELRGRYPAYTSVRGGLALGLRYLDFTPLRGFDALTGRQDVGRGVQLSTRLTRSLWAEGGVDRDILVGTSLYAGRGTPRSITAVQLDMEGRRQRGAPAWDGIVGSGRAAWYLRPTERWLHLVSVEGSGGWRTRVPYQLSAGDLNGGMRGYRDTEVGGARRVVLRLEERLRLPVIRGRADAALAVFSDAGRIWAGTVPFGVTTPIIASAGASFLLASPVGSARTLRLDVGVPLVALPGTRSVDLRLTYRDFTRGFWLEPFEVSRARQGAMRGAVFIDQ
jgi:hypothetical protein